MFEFANVSELNTYAGNLLSRDARLSRFIVTGEISGLTVYRQSGHCYFTLKDGRSQISCVMFATYFNQVDFPVKDGLKVKIIGSADIYSANGKYQIKVFAMQEIGKGDLSEQYKKLFEKLNNEGLFAPENKKKIPVLPRRIGVITSPSGAVIHDIINTLNRRNPFYDILVYPATVQGETCPKDVCEGLDYFINTKSVDVIIIARGGGSLEDLFGFNDEALARKIYACEIPVISAVGHEVDYTICDFVSDLRAPTPTAAAELVLGKFDDLLDVVRNHRAYLEMAADHFISGNRDRLSRLKNHKALYSPHYYVQNQRNKLNLLTESLIHSGESLISTERNTINELLQRMEFCERNLITGKKNELNGLALSLDALGPTKVLSRGYSYITSKDSNEVIKSVNEITAGSEVKIIFSDGSAEATISDKINKTED